MKARWPANSRLVYLLFIVLAFLLTGCQSYTRAVQPQAANPYLIKDGNSLGQSFIAGYDGLDGIYFFLAPDKPGDGKLILYLQSEPGADDYFTTASLPLDAITTTGYYGFYFSHLDKSQRSYYYASLELQGEGEVFLYGAQGNTYLEGALYQNYIPINAQAAFRLSYSPAPALIGLLGLGTLWMAVLAASFALFVLPGLALVTAFLPDYASLSIPEKIGIGGGLSLAIYPILFLWTGLFGIRLGGLYAWLPIFFAACFYCLTLFRKYRVRRQSKESVFRFHKPLLTPVASLAYLLVVGAVIFSRFWAIRSLDVPMFGDSYQHTLITQLIINNRGLFESWKPYTDLSTFTYHFGFHTLAASFHWLTGMNAIQSTMWVGQTLNILAILALYPVAVIVGKNHWAGILAVMVGGLFSPMPMAYVNWGRYTQLTGQVILLAAIWLLWFALKRDRLSRNLVFLSALTLGGLSLTHYRVLIFAVLFFPAFLIVNMENWRWFLRKTGIIMWVGAISGIIFLPWFIHVYGGRISQILTFQITTQPTTTTGSAAGTIGNLFIYLPPLLWLLLPLCFGLLLFRHNREAAVLGLWWFLIFWAGHPQWLSLPGQGVVSSFAVLIALFIPASIIIGSGLAPFMHNITMPMPSIKIERFTTRVNLLISFLSILVMVSIISLWGVRLRMQDVNLSAHALATRADIHASNWIRANTSSEATFLVNSFFAYQNTAVVGGDGGWWLPLLAERKTTLPPLNYTLETDPWPGYRLWINSLTEEIQIKGIDHPDVIDALLERRVTHVYVGQQQGRVNYSGPYVLQPEDLLSSPHYRPVYHQDLVWIFEVLH